MDVAIRIAAIPALAFWELVIDVFHPIEKKISGEETSQKESKKDKTFDCGNINEQPEVKTILYELTSVDHVPPNLPKPSGKGKDCIARRQRPSHPDMH